MDTTAEKPASLAELFAAQVARAPAATALLGPAERLSYAELDRRAGRLAARLRALGVGPEVAVGLCAERSAALVVGVLGIAKAGGAYVPLDPGYPAGRLAGMLADAAAPVVVAEAHLAAALPPFDGIVALLGEGFEAATEMPGGCDSWELRGVGAGGSGAAVAAPADGGAAAPPDAECLAYVMFTSGSTGRPKGVAVPQRAVRRLVLDTNYVQIRPGDRVAQVSNPSFDAATFEIWGALLNGACLVVIRREAALAPRELAEQIERHGVSVMFLTTALFNQVARERPAAFRALRCLLFGGEAVDAGAVRAVLAAGAPHQLLHVYGPTESTTFASYHPVTAVAADAVTVPIGRPLTGTALHVVDTELRRQPEGAAGELLLGGAGLARGYLASPELTALRFVPDPFGPPGGRVYRTGDRVRQDSEGNLEFLGRFDHQVKLRGFRIELGEVEAALASHPAVHQAVAAVEAGADGDRQLVAYLAAGGGAARAGITAASLRAFLLARLPEFMVPVRFVVLPALPLNENGKVDRGALAAAARAGTAGRAAAAGLDPAQRLMPGIPAAPRDRPLPLSFAQERLWLIDRMQPGLALYNVPFALRLTGRLERAALRRALAALVRRHEALRTTFVLAGNDPVQVIAVAAPEPEAGAGAGGAPPPVGGAVPAGRSWLPLADLSGLGGSGGPGAHGGPGEAARRRAAAALPAEMARRPFDLARGPLLRTLLVREAEDQHILILVLHHIICDGWSLSVLTRELMTLYLADRGAGQGQPGAAAAAGRRPDPLPELPLQYADFAVWQRRWLSGARLALQVAWWRQQLAAAPAVLELPTDRPRPALRTFRGAERVIRLPEETSRRALAASRPGRATLFMILVTAWAALLARYSGQDEVVVGFPIANRNRREIENLVGFFVNTLVLRADLTGHPGFAAALERIRRTTLGAYAHQDLPFEMLIELLQPKRRMDTSPLFQVLFAVQNMPPMALALPGLAMTPLLPGTGTAKFDLTMSLQQEGDRILGTLEYNADLYDGATATRLVEHFHRLLAGAMAAPGRCLIEVPLLSSAERHQLLAEWNDAASAPAGEPRDPGGPPYQAGAGRRAVLLDRHLGLAPLGGRGELCFGGDAPDPLAAEAAGGGPAFWPDPWSAAPGARLHRTGHLYRRLSGGALQQLDGGGPALSPEASGRRNDLGVLGAVEAILLTHPAVGAALAVEQGESVVAYLVPRRNGRPPAAHAGSGQAPDAGSDHPGDRRRDLPPDGLTAQLLDHLRSRLGAAAPLPERLMLVDALPLLTGGGVDRERAGRLGAARPSAPAAAPEAAPYEAPRTAMEDRIAAIWHSHLQCERVGIHDNFFDLGGHSLQLARVHSALEEALGRRIPMVDLFQHPTVAALARHLSAGEEEAAPSFAHSQDRADRRRAALARRDPGARRRGDDGWT